jgi:hypothetical protein
VAAIAVFTQLACGDSTGSNGMDALGPGQLDGAADVAVDSPPPAPTPDAGTDQGPAPADASDAGPSTCGCGKTPVCGVPCSSSCGCCPCVSGMTMTTDAGVFVCVPTGSCYAPQADGGGTD